MPRYELSDGTSNKFWQIELEGALYKVTFGKIGAKGQTQLKEFDSDAAALDAYNKLIAEKTKKGYQLVGSAASTTTSSGAGTSTAGTSTTGASAAGASPAVSNTGMSRPAGTSATTASTGANASTSTGASTSTRASTTTASAAAPTTARVAMTDAAKRAAKEELASVAIKPAVVDNPIGQWLTDIYRPFVEKGKAVVQNGLPRANAEAQRLGKAVLREHGSMEKMPKTLDVETSAAALQLLPDQRVEAPAVMWFFIAHSGLGFALEVFATSLWNWTVSIDDPYNRLGARFLAPATERRLADLFAGRADRAIAACWHTATAADRAKAEELRSTGGLLVRSAIASATLEPAWIDADLREHATTGARAMLSPEALLVASSAADVATYLTHVPAEDHGFYPVYSPYTFQHGAPVIRGFAYVERLGLGGIDIARARIAQLLPTCTGESYQVGRAAGEIRALLEVVRLAHDYPPALETAVAVIDKTDDLKLSKDFDPTPIAYDLLRASPALALSALRATRRGWAKDLAPKLERLAGGGAAADLADASAAALPRALQGAPAKWKAPEFWQPIALPRIVLRDGTAYPVDCLDALAAVLKAGDADTIAELAQLAEPASLAAFGWDLFQAWLTSGAPSKEKWAFTQLGLVGGDETARRLTPLIRAWPGESQHQRAVAGLDVLGQIGSDVALMMLNGIAQKVKFKGLQERARDKMDEIAQKRGITAEQLADRLVPDLDLEDDGSKTLDFGPRSFRVGFDETLSPFVIDATGARLKDLPKPNSKDDATLGAAATETWKAMKKDVRALAGIQLLRLELGMGNARQWSGEEFRNFFVEHPLMTHLVRRLVWGVYDDDEGLQRTFRVAEDRTYADIHDDACEVSADATIGIVHRLHLSDADAAAWGKLFADYELAQPFEQLARAVYRLDDEERRVKQIARFDGRVVETKKVLSLLSRGWRKGAPQDNGWIHVLYKPIDSKLIASLPIEGGISAASMEYVDPKQTLGAIDFAPSEPSWGYARQDAVVLGEIDAVIVSEVIRDVESLGATDEEEA